MTIKMKNLLALAACFGAGAVLPVIVGYLLLFRHHR
jgi:hypothetical protein